MEESKLAYSVLIWMFSFFFGGYFICRFMVKKITNMISKSGFVVVNYEGRKIPVGVGIVISLTGLILSFIAFCTMPSGMELHILMFLLALVSFTLLGLMDDVWGSREVTGLKGHFLSFFKGKITTGGIKALVGILVATLLALVEGDLRFFALEALIIALSVNCINLFDLRPGRAGKFFILIFILICLIGTISYETALLFGIMGALLAYLPFDLRAKVMLGDTGSNALGAVLGLMAIWLFSLPLQISYLVFLILLHIFSEKYSITKFVEKFSFLRKIDEWGRR